MGTVYLAEHAFMGWRAAIKVLRRSLADDKVLVTRFINEARAAKAVGHPNIIEIIDVGILPDGLPYLLMEMLEGETLGARLRAAGAAAGRAGAGHRPAGGGRAGRGPRRRHRPPRPQARQPVPGARPGQRPARERVKVLDFGIAKLDDGRRRDPRPHQERRPAGHARVHVARAVPEHPRRSRAATSTRSRSSCTRCSRAGRRSSARARARCSSCRWTRPPPSGATGEPRASRSSSRAPSCAAWPSRASSASSRCASWRRRWQGVRQRRS